MGRFKCPRDECEDDLDILRDGMLFEDVVPVELEEVVEFLEDVESCFSGTRGSIFVKLYGNQIANTNFRDAPI